MARIIVAFVTAVLAVSRVTAQITTFPYQHSFDSTGTLPADWSASGFIVNSSSSRSAPYCLSATGNYTKKAVTTPSFDFRRHSPTLLTYWERRSSTASAFHLSVWADAETDSILLDCFDSISTVSGYVLRSITLTGRGLEGHASVRFRWQVSTDSTSTTGVLRMDDLLIEAVPSNDLSAGRIIIAPQRPSRIDTIQLYAVIRNVGRFPVSMFTCRYFASRSRDAIFQDPALHTISSGPILPGDSVLLHFAVPPNGTGLWWFGVHIVSADDENPRNDTTTASLAVGSAVNDIVINEIMYTPAGDEPEWIELFNTTEDSIDLRSWTIADNSPTTRTPLTDRSVWVSAHSYVIIARDVLFLQIYPNVSVPMLIASFSSLNNTTPDAVVLRDAGGRTIDSAAYNPQYWTNDGRSLERVDPFLPADWPENWSFAIDTVHATPGRLNSTARRNHDLTISHLSIDRLSLQIEASVRNIGRLPMSGFVVTAVKFGTDSIPVSLGTRYPPETLDAGDSCILVFALDTISAGRTRVLAEVFDSLDERHANDRLEAWVDQPYPQNIVAINEIMFDPSEGSPEWVEICNPGPHTLSLDGWTLSDAPTSSGATVRILLSGLLSPHEYMVIAADSSIFRTFPVAHLDPTAIFIASTGSGGLSLNNEEDAVVIRDRTDVTIDSVRYSSRWHHPDVSSTRGRSLERIHPQLTTLDPRNWSTCTRPAGGTPGEANSILAALNAPSARVTITPNPFSPDGDGFEDFAVIQYSLTDPSSFVQVKIFDTRGRLIRRLSNFLFSGTQGAIVWDGSDDRGARVPLGAYIVLFQASGSVLRPPFEAKVVAAVAGRGR